MVNIKRNRTVADRTAQYLTVWALTGIALYSLNRFWLIPQLPTNHFFRAYGDDILALPIFVPLSYLLARKLALIKPEKYLTGAYILIAWIVFSLLFEGLAPLMMAHRYADWGDVNAYALGGIGLWLVNYWMLDFAHLRVTAIRKIYYDGTCGICRAGVKWSSRRVAESAALDFQPFQQIEPGPAAELYKLAQHTVVVILADGTQLVRNRAVGRVFLALNPPWACLGWFLTAVIFTPISSPGYRLAARYRHKLSRWFSLTSCVNKP